MPLHTDLESLVSLARFRIEDALDEMNSDAKLKSLGVERVIVNESLRELSVQMAYYSRSRMSVQDVQAMYKAAGLYAIGEVEAKKPNTWTLESKHLGGTAADLVPIHNGKAWWAAPLAVWERMGEIGEKHGLKWGGRWKTPDSPHFEL